MSFVVHTQVEATQEAWDSPRRYREFTQLRKRLLRLGIDIPTSAGTRNGDAGGGDGGGLAPDLPKKTWRTNKFDGDHLETRRAALEAYLRAAVKVGGTSRGRRRAVYLAMSVILNRCFVWNSSAGKVGLGGSGGGDGRCKFCAAGSKVIRLVATFGERVLRWTIAPSPVFPHHPPPRA